MKKWLLYAVILGALALAPFFLLVRFISSPGPPGAAPRIVNVPEGAGLRTIARALERGGAVSDARLFTAYALIRGEGRKLRPGEYAFAPGATPEEVLGKLRAGDVLRHRVTLPEGWTAAQMADAIGRTGVAPAERLKALARDPAFIRGLGVPGATLEGYAFPDTYDFPRGTSPEEIWRRLVGRFRHVYAEERRAAGEARGSAPAALNDHEVVTLASIVEKETGRPAERPLIAAVFLNRLRRGIPLASDPTVIYGLASFDGNLRRADLEAPSAYNTYVHAGLPPGPIANPGRDSIRAVLRAPAVDYLYFVSRNDGSHQFSRTLEEHNRAVREFQSRGRPPGPASPPPPPRPPSGAPPAS
jgi:UPF0755 protein